MACWRAGLFFVYIIEETGLLRTSFFYYIAFFKAFLSTEAQQGRGRP